MKDITQASVKTDLANRTCQSCESGEGRLTAPTIKTLMKQLPGNWKLKGTQLLEKTYKFRDFQQALAFTNQVGALAEEQEHHPDILLTYGQVRIQLSTHHAKGLTENDFILAAKINELE